MMSVIVAVSRNGVIGSENRMPWHISEDLRRFKAITTGHPVVMGRKTWESLGRPLPGRVNVVITRQAGFVPTTADGSTADAVRTAGSLAEAAAMFPADEEVFVIGGGQIYAQAMAVADKFYLTEVDADADGDVLFPAWSASEWEEVFHERHERGAAFGHPFTFRDFIRRELTSTR